MAHAHPVFSNIFFWETTEPIPCGVSLGWGNKHLFKWSWSHDQDDQIFFSEPKGRWPSNFVYCIGDLSSTKNVQMMILCWPWPTLWQCQLCSLMLLYGKILDFRETIEVYELKVNRLYYIYSWLSEYMNTYEYQRSRSLLDLCPRSVTSILSNIFCCECAWPIEAKFHVELLWVVKMKICSNGPGHVTRMATWLTLTYFTARSTLFPNAFVMLFGKCLKSRF